MNEERRTRPYHILNITLAGVIILIFAYSGFFSAQKNNHPIPSIYEKISGEPSNSSGLSRAFSEILRGNFDSARAYNKNSIPVFLFFLIQFFQRIGISFVVKKGRLKLSGIVKIDIAASTVLFLVCFWGLMRSMAQMIF
jgi:hypothetical protein